jgi:chromosome segregation ATPase
VPKINDSTLTAETAKSELSDLLKMRDEEGQLLLRRNEVKRTLYSLNLARTFVLPPIIYDHLGIPSLVDRKDAKRQAEERHEAKIVAAERELAEIEARLRQIVPAIAETSKRVAELQDRAEGEKFTRIEKAIAAAIASAPSREPLAAGRQKLRELKLQFDDVEQELHQVQTRPETLQETAEDRARLLLETGQFAAEANRPTAEQRAKELLSKQRVLREACRLQEREIEKLRMRFAGEVVSGLRKIMHDIVGRMVEGYDRAREAVREAGLLRSELERRTQSSEYLPAFVYPKIEHPLQDVADAWSMFLDDLRRQGYEV